MDNVTVAELKEMLQYYFAGTKEIRKIGCIGENRALEIKRLIKEKIFKEGKKYIMPQNMVPMCEVFEYFGIDIDYLYKVTEITERKIVNGRTK
jgi:hypothetical protein